MAPLLSWKSTGTRVTPLWQSPSLVPAHGGPGTASTSRHEKFTGQGQGFTAAATHGIRTVLCRGGHSDAQ